MVDRIIDVIRRNFFLLGVTAFPGFHKLVVLFAVNQVDSVYETADFINDTFILYLLGYYTVFNWSNFILADMMKLPKAKHDVFFGRIAGLSLFTNIPIFIVLYVLFQLGWISDLYGFGFLLITWSYHQLWRHYFIARKGYQNLFISDFIVLVFTVLVIVVSSKCQLNRYAMMSIPVVLVPIFFKILKPVIVRKRLNLRVLRRAMNYTLINLSTGGVQLIFAPLSHQLLSAELTRIIGFTTNIASVALLIPRALSFQFIPLLSEKLRQSKRAFSELFLLFSRKNNQSILLMLLLGFAIGLYTWLVAKQVPLEMLVLSFAVFMNLLFGQFAAPPSNVLVVKSQSDYLLIANVVSFVVVVMEMLLILSTDMDPMNKMFSMIGFNICIGLIRYVYLLSLVRRML